MGSYIDEGFYDDSDSIYKEGFSIMAQKKSQKKTKNSNLPCGDKSQKEAKTDFKKEKS